MTAAKPADVLGSTRLPFSAERFPGLLIVAEGASCSGKSFFLSTLAEQEPDAVVVEWNSHPLVRPGVDELKHRQALSPVGHLLAGLLDHRVRLDEEVLPALRRGVLVLSDRYLFTSVVRDGLRGVPPNVLTALAPQYPAPDALYYFEPERSVRLARYQLRPSSYGYYARGQDLLPQLSADDAFAEYTDRQVAVYRGLAHTNGFVVDDHLAHATRLIKQWRIQSHHQDGDEIHV
jgi:dTMP kinase